MKDHWKDYQTRWHLLEAPLRPNQEVVDAIMLAVGGETSNVLLLGVTPELVEAFEHLTAVDKSEEMIGALWRPSKSTQVVREANWLDMDDAFGPYTAVIGDYSINTLQSTDEIETLMRVVRARLLNGGVFACRVFERPDEPIEDQELQASIEDASHGNFHALKWQIAMSLAERFGGSVKAIEILDSFNRLFPDRDSVAEKTGWSLDVINTIDVYEQSSMALCFPNHEEFERHFAQGFRDIEWRTSGTYDLAERCPIVLAKP
ncbi:MAG: hypothetical protein ACC642_03040 [Pseudomonadales bacterium]